jgi:hypothetical protein
MGHPGISEADDANQALVAFNSAKRVEPIDGHCNP